MDVRDAELAGLAGVGVGDLPVSERAAVAGAQLGREPLLAAYAPAVQARYRFFSYGDAMFLTPSATALARP